MEFSEEHAARLFKVALVENRALEVWQALRDGSTVLTTNSGQLLILRQQQLDLDCA